MVLTAKMQAVHIQNHNRYTTAKVIYSVAQEGEIEDIHALLMMANKPETTLYRIPTFSLLLASHAGNRHEN